MLPIFNHNSPALLKKRAKQDFDKVSVLGGGGRTARSLRVRMGLLSRAHLDKTFIDGAEKMALYQDVMMAALAAGQSLPPEPQFSLFQLVDTLGGSAFWVYLPQEYVEKVFTLGMSYQRMNITAQVAIDSVQSVLDQICRFEFKLEESLMGLQFLRDEMAQAAGGDDSGSATSNADQPTDV